MKTLHIFPQASRNLLLIVAGLFYFSGLRAQDISLTGANPSYQFVFKMGPIPAETPLFGVEAASGNVFWEFGPGALPPGITGQTTKTFTKNGIKVTIPGDAPGSVSETLNVTIEGTPTISESFSFTFDVTVSEADDSDCPSVPNPMNPCPPFGIRSNTVTIRPEVEMVLVLDASGSMGWDYAGNSPPIGDRRWDGLKSGVGAMANTLAGLNVIPSSLITEDKLGIRMFSTSPIIPASPFSATNVIPLAANISSISSAVPNNPPGGWTGLGDGIIAGRDIFTSSTTSDQEMIVFSDGEQTFGNGEGPMVKTTGTGAFQETISGQSLSNSGQIRIHTIGLGTTGSIPATMAQIALLNGGGEYLNAYASTGGADDFPTFFASILNTIFSNSSPQFVDVRKSYFPGSTAKETNAPPPPMSEQSFSINKGVSSLNVVFFAPTRNEPHFISFMKDTDELIGFAQQSSGPGFISIGMNYPIDSLPGSALDGKWTVQARLGTEPETAIPYTMMIVADDHFVHPSYSLGAQSFKVGDILYPTVTLQQTGQSITNATVQAFILKPGENIDDLIARSQVDYSLPAEDSASPNIAKLAVLMNDSTFIKKIEAQERQINLVYSAADSTYKGKFSDLDVAGVYQILYRITANDPILGTIQRFQQKSFYVRFPDIDLDNSDLIPSEDPQTGNSTLRVRFISGDGKYIGSGWGTTIGIEAPGLDIQKVDDLGDGSYIIYFDGKLAGNGKLSLFTETFFEGDLATIGETSSKSGFGVSVHGGRTFPTGTFDNEYNPGWLGEVNLEYQFSQHFSAELVGGYYNFDFDYKIVGATAYLKGHAVLGSYHAYLSAGSGYYKPDNIEESYGISGKVGLQRPLGKKLWIDLNGAYFRLFVPEDNRDFMSVSFGFKYFF